MGVALLICRLLLAGVFIGAGLAKLADRGGTRTAVVEFGVSERLAGLVVEVLPVLELAIGIAVVPSSTARSAALAAAVLLLAFSAAIVNAMAHGRAPDCHCFGQVHSAPAGWRTLLRNLVLLGLAAFVAIAGWEGAGVSATHWVAQLHGTLLVVIVAGLIVLGLVAFQLWFSFELLAQNGRALRRLDALEEMVAALGLPDGAPPEPPVLGEGLVGGGLAVGSPAPLFELRSVGGEPYSLAEMLGRRRPVMLIFSDAGCGPCAALMPTVAVWQREHQDQIEIAVIAGGDPGSNRAKAGEHGLEQVLLQTEGGVAKAYEAHGTPMAVVIGADGLIASPTVGGAEAITTLMTQATRPVLAIRQHVPSGNGAPPGTPQAAYAGPDTTRIGDPAPALSLSDLDGRPVALSDLYGERTLALFWNPGCGFCQQMLPDLKAFEADPPAGAPQLVVISIGDRDEVREHGLRSPVLLDSDGSAMRAFEANGTPMGVLVERGKIASSVAAGAVAVFELARHGAPN
jgi:peroxiredoxin/uncharacterized membrane protein YphA (DoxX/SURF4 family)